MIHRDIKPENLLISLSGSLKLCDFGFARTVNTSEVLTDYVATRWYRAPELLVGMPYDISVDMWAIGCMMAELIDAQPLFPGESDIDQIYCIQKALGGFMPAHMECFNKNQIFQGMKLPKIQKLEGLEKRYSGKIEGIAIQFICSLVELDPEKRLTAKEALMHPYFSGVISEKRPQTSLNMERGRSPTGFNYYNNVKINFPEQNIMMKRKSQKKYGTLSPEKRKLLEKEKNGTLEKKHFANTNEKIENKFSNPVFHSTFHEINKEAVMKKIEERGGRNSKSKIRNEQNHVIENARVLRENEEAFRNQNYVSSCFNFPKKKYEKKRRSDG